MKKNVWILNHYASHMIFDKGGRHYGFSKYLKRSGYEPVVFCCNTVHGDSKKYLTFNGIWQEKISEEIGVPFVFVNSIVYKNAYQRVLNMVGFYNNVRKAAKEYAEQHGKPDVIIASSVHPLTMVAGIKLAKEFGVKCICEIRDLWPESIVMYSKHLKKSNPLIKILYSAEKWIYKKADALIFTMEGAYDYILDQGWGKSISREKFFTINNGIDLQEYEYNRDHYTICDEDLENESIFKIVYTGSIRRVNNVGLLLDMAKQVNAPQIKFLIWGDGDEKAMLEQRVEEEGLTNVAFKGKVPKQCVPYIVSKADLNYAHNEPSPLFKYGISFNKLFDYLAAGRPILCDFPCPYNPAVMGNAAFEVQNPTPDVIAAKINLIFAMPKQEFEQIGYNARQVSKKYSFDTLTQRLIAIIESFDT